MVSVSTKIILVIYAHKTLWKREVLEQFSEHTCNLAYKCKLKNALHIDAVCVHLDDIILRH